MSGFIRAPVFLPVQRPLRNGAPGQVLGLVGPVRQWVDESGGGGGVGSYASVAPTAGVHNNFALAAGVGRLDIDTTAGDVELTGIAASTDATLLIVTSIGGNNVILDPLNAGSTAANQFRLPGQMYLPLNDAVLLCYYAGSINKWCMA